MLGGLAIIWASTISYSIDRHNSQKYRGKPHKDACPNARAKPVYLPDAIAMLCSNPFHHDNSPLLQTPSSFLVAAAQKSREDVLARHAQAGSFRRLLCGWLGIVHGDVWLDFAMGWCIHVDLLRARGRGAGWHVVAIASIVDVFLLGVVHVGIEVLERSHGRNARCWSVRSAAAGCTRRRSGVRSSAIR